MHTSQKNKIKRILWLSDSPTCNTGFGVVSKNLIDNICLIMGDEIQIDVIAINLQEESIQYNTQTTLYDGRQDGNTYDSHGRSFFLNILRHNPDPYDAIFILHDFPVVVNMIPILKSIKTDFLKTNKKSFKSFLYVPVDGFVPDWSVKGLDFFDFIATYTDWGKKEIVRATPMLRKKIKVIPHGCNTNQFYNIPKSEIADFRKEYFGEESDDKIIFTNVNRNQPRKGIVDTILAFCQVKEDWNIKGKYPFLYLHMDRKDTMGYDLDIVFSQLSLQEGKDYKIAPIEYFTNRYGVETETLNKIYNASDIFITTTLGEGWGLSVTEAMAVKLPVICPQHTSLMYISDFGKRAYTLKNLYPNCSSNDSLIREQIEIDETASVMIQAATDLTKNNQNDKVKLAYEFVRSLNWKEISSQFVKNFNELI